MKRRAFSIVMCVMLAVSVWGVMPVKKAQAYNCVSTGTGNWSDAGMWTGCNSSTPQSGDTVTIKDNHTVTLDTSPTIASLTIGEGASGVLIFDSIAVRTLTVSGNVIVNSGAQFITQSSGAQIPGVFIGGNLTNSGTFDMSRGGTTLIANVTFNGVTNQTVSGSGGTTRFNFITINNTGTAPNNIVEIASNNFAVPGGFLDATTGLTAGILKLSGSYTLNTTFFSATAYKIGAVAGSSAGVWLNNSNVTVAGQNGSPTNNGMLRITAGTYNVGTSSGNSMSAGAGASFIIEGGALNITGRLQTASAVTYYQSGGTVNVSTSGNGSSSLASFDLTRLLLASR